MTNKNESENKFVIGGGVAGLLAAYFFNDYILISPKEGIGGQLTAPFQLGPRFVRNTPEFRVLLKVLKIKYNIVTKKVAYFDGKMLSEKITEEFVKNYTKNTRQIAIVNKSFMNDGLNRFECLEFPMDILIRKLKVRLSARTINASVERIDYENSSLTLDSRETLDYSHIISTIHFDSFMKLCGIEHDYKFSDIYFYLMPYDTPWEELKDRYAFIYICDSSPFNRITYTDDGMVFESPHQLSPKELRSYPIQKEAILPKCKLRGQYKLPNLLGITFFGRYAELDNEIRIHELLNKLVDMKEQEKINKMHKAIDNDDMKRRQK